MAIDELSEVAGLPFMQSRIPALDALVAFVPEGHHDPVVENVGLSGPSRWYPVEGGMRVVVLYEGGEFDAERFHIEKGAWDHEHCEHCGAHIPSMTLCWVTEDGPYILLCDECHSKIPALPA